MKKSIVLIIMCFFVVSSCKVLCPCTKTKSISMIECLPTTADFLKTTSPNVQINIIEDRDKGEKTLNLLLEKYKFEVEFNCQQANFKYLWITRYHDLSFLYPSGKVLVMASFYGQLENNNNSWVLKFYLSPKWRPVGGSDKWIDPVPKEMYDQLRNFLEDFKKDFEHEYNTL